MAKHLELAAGIREWMLANISPDSLPEGDRERDMAYLRGERGLTMTQILKLANRTHIPSGYFFLSSPPNETVPLLEYRTVDSVDNATPSRDLIDTIRRMESIQEWMRDELEFCGIQPASLAGSVLVEDGVMVGASKIRTLLDLREDWYRNSRQMVRNAKLVRDRIEQCGVTVIFGTTVNKSQNRVLEVGEFRAFAMADDKVPLIFVNENDTKGAQLFSLLHEFTHICLGSSDLFNENAKGNVRVPARETFCNRVTAEILVPMDHFMSAGNPMRSPCFLALKG